MNPTSEKQRQQLCAPAIRQIVVAVDLSAHSEKTVADEISQLARTLDANLIITASRHTSFLGRLFDLDQVPRIMHRAPCSVLVYHD